MSTAISTSGSSVEASYNRLVRYANMEKWFALTPEQGTLKKTAIVFASILPLLVLTPLSAVMHLAKWSWQKLSSLCTAERKVALPAPSATRTAPPAAELPLEPPAAVAPPAAELPLEPPAAVALPAPLAVVALRVPSNDEDALYTDSDASDGAFQANLGAERGSEVRPRKMRRTEDGAFPIEPSAAWEDGAPPALEFVGSAAAHVREASDVEEGRYGKVFHDQWNHFMAELNGLQLEGGLEASVTLMARFARGPRPMTATEAAALPLVEPARVLELLAKLEKALGVVLKSINGKDCDLDSSPVMIGFQAMKSLYLRGDQDDTLRQAAAALSEKICAEQCEAALEALSQLRSPLPKYMERIQDNLAATAALVEALRKLREDEESNAPYIAFLEKFLPADERGGAGPAAPAQAGPLTLRLKAAAAAARRRLEEAREEDEKYGGGNITPTRSQVDRIRAEMQAGHSRKVRSRSAGPANVSSGSEGDDEA